MNPLSQPPRRQNNCRQILRDSKLCRAQDHEGVKQLPIPQDHDQYHRRLQSLPPKNMSDSYDEKLLDCSTPNILP